MKFTDEKRRIRSAAKDLAKKNGLINLSRKDVCERASVPDGSFPHIMGCTFAELIEEIKPEVSNNIAHPVNKQRANPAMRREQLLQAAIEIAKGCGYRNITRTAVAERADVSMGLVSQYFGTVTELKETVMLVAIEREILEIIGQGLGCCDPLAQQASQRIKNKAVKMLANS